MSIAALRAKRASALDELTAKRAPLFDKFKALAEKPAAEFNKSVDQPEYDRLKKEIDALDARIKVTGDEFDAEIKRAQDVQDMARGTAVAVHGQPNATTLAATPKKDKDEAWTNEDAAKRLGHGTHKGLIAGGIIKMVGLAGNPYLAKQAAMEVYGENHPVTKALIAGSGASGGFIVPPDYVNEIIELLRPQAVVRSANPRTMPMPRGTLTLPAQTAAATAQYQGETTQITSSQPQVGQIVATYKKLTALVPVSNDLLRYADPAADALVRDDLVKVTALREDLAFMMGDGTADTPRGFLSFANMWVLQNGGTQGTWSSTANSTFAVNDPAGGNFATANQTYSLATVSTDLGGAIDLLDTANVPDFRRVWFMHPRTWNYLNSVQNSLGVYVYRDELSKGTLLGYPFRKSTQIPINIWNADGSHKDLSFIFLVEMTDALVLDAMTLELAVSREGVYYDTSAVLQSAFQKDLTLIRGIMEHDFQMRHPASVAVIQAVRYAPTIS